MDVSRRRAGRRSGVVAGSVWESRMKIDEVRGGIKVFNGEEESNEESGSVTVTELKGGQSQRGGGGGAISGKRKTWKPEGSEGFGKNPIQIALGETEALDEPAKELRVSAEGINKSPILMRKVRSEGGREIGVSVDKTERSPIQMRKPRSILPKGSGELRKEVCESGEASEKKNSFHSGRILDGSDNGRSSNGNSFQLKKTKSETDKNLDESRKGNTDESIDEIEIRKNKFDETCKEFGVCQEKVIPSCTKTTNVGAVKSATKMLVYHNNDDDDEEEEEEEEMDEIEKKGFDIKKINLPERKKVQVVKEVKKLHHFNEKSVPSSFTVKRPPPPSVKNHSTIYQNLPKPAPSPDEFHSFSENHNKLQSLVDLILWRDVSRSAFVFGIGTFIIISSSYTKDINISFISVISYLGLVYLAAIFLYRSIISRGAIDIDDESYVVGEEEAIWVLKLFLPYINEFLLKLKALFCGDPATTIKLAVLLFVLARCGSSITIWKVLKWGFFGVFTVPKACSSYSTQLTAHAKFWIRRFRDAWNSCSHKKGVAIAIFMLVWNMSSTVARIWALFILFVALRYYQQTLVTDSWVDDEDRAEETSEIQSGVQRLGFGVSLIESSTKQKKKF